MAADDTKISLSNVSPSYEQIYDQLAAQLTNKYSWLSLSRSSTATMLLEAISAVGESSQYSTMMAAREVFLETAKCADSIYYNVRFLGVRISRKIPATVKVNIQNSNINSPYIEIPAYTQFTVGDRQCFNRIPIIINNATDVISVELYEGEVKRQTFIASGAEYQRYNLVDTPWGISNSDIICKADSLIEYKRSEDPIFLFGAGENKFYENTLPDGTVECRFGNGIYGAIPQANSSLEFTYTVTTGSTANNNALNLEVSCNDFPDIIGESTTIFYNGSDEKDIRYYSELGAQAGASNGRCIIRDDFRPIILQTPGVIDCKAYGQAEIAPNDKDWMNVVGLMLLVDDSFTNDSWKSLIANLKTKRIWGFQFKRFYPKRVALDISVTLYLNNKAQPSKCRDRVEKAIRDYMKLGVGSLGKSFFKSDLDNVILSTLLDDIDYDVIDAPAVDYEIDPNTYIELNSLIIKTYYSEREQNNLR